MININRYTFVDSTWISQCIQEKSLVDINPYIIDFFNSSRKTTPLKFPSRKDATDRETKSIEEDIKPMAEEPRNIPKTEDYEDILNVEEWRKLRKSFKTNVNQRSIEENRPFFDYLYGIPAEDLHIQRESNKESTKVEMESEYSSKDRDTSNEGKISSVKSSDLSDQDHMSIRRKQTGVSSDEEDTRHVRTPRSFGGSSDNRISFRDSSDESKKGKESKDSNYWKTRQKFLSKAPIQKNNLNSHITEPLETLMKIYAAQGDKGRYHAYRKASNFLQVFPKKIESEDDFQNIRNVGPKIGEKIKEILRTGKLKKTDLLTEDDKVKTIDLFTTVWGIGLKKANELYQKKIKDYSRSTKKSGFINQTAKNWS